MKVDINNINIPEIKQNNIDTDVFNLTSENIQNNTSKYLTKYGVFYERYVRSFLNPSGISDTLYAQNVLSFVNDKDMHETFMDIQKKYPENKRSDIYQELISCAKRYHYFFPKKTLPKQIVFGLSGYNYAVAFVDSTLFVSLDMFLGHNSKFYAMLNWPTYKTRVLSEPYLVSETMRGWMLSELDNEMPTNNLLHHTIFYGKLYYAVKRLVPEAHDSILIGYSSKQLDYCRTYEKELWGFMIEKNKLYENDMRTVQELTSEGPFTGAISKDCPPGIAKWIGWQIVESYMNNNEKVSMEELFNETDAQKILTKSKYRP
ncbi:MAG: hypothetical protein AB7O73_02870 [Bacteroidia bacterium]